MKVQRVLHLTILVIWGLNCYSQDVNKKYLIGASLSYSHDDLSNNRLLSNYYTVDKYVSNTLNVSGEFGYFLTQNTLLGIELEYLSNKLNQEQKAKGISNSDVFDIKSSGISINPKYKVIRKISDKIWFYTDFKLAFQYLSHENIVSQLNVSTYAFEYLDMNGTEVKYGCMVYPGLIFKIHKSWGVKIDYSLFNALHSTIKKTDDSEVDFDTIKAWDYNLNMQLSGFNLGVIITL